MINDAHSNVTPFAELCTLKLFSENLFHCACTCMSQNHCCLHKSNTHCVLHHISVFSISKPYYTCLQIFWARLNVKGSSYWSLCHPQTSFTWILTILRHIPCLMLQPIAFAFWGMGSEEIKVERWGLTTNCEEYSLSNAKSRIASIFHSMDERDAKWKVSFVFCRENMHQARRKSSFSMKEHVSQWR